MSEFIPDEFDRLPWPVGVASGLVWFLGPAANAVRKNLALWSDYQSANILRLAQKTNARELPQAEGEVHPKVAQQILAEASWADDDVAQEYFAGMLIGSRNAKGLEGDNAYFARLTSNLTALHLRTHHMIYAAVAGIGEGNELRTRQGANAVFLYFSLETLASALGITDINELASVGRVASVLEREDLIGEYAFDPDPDAVLLKSFFPGATGPGLAVKATTLGVQLFLKAYGIDDLDSNRLLRLKDLPRVETTMPRAAEVLYAPGVVRAPH